MPVTSEMLMRKRWIAAVVAVACLGCCAPLFLPLIAGSAVLATSGGLFFGMQTGDWLCIVLIALLVAGALTWALIRRRRHTKSCDCTNACSTTEAGSCKEAGPQPSP